MALTSKTELIIKLYSNGVSKKNILKYVKVSKKDLQHILSKYASRNKSYF